MDTKRLKTFMLIAGEPSGDLLASELVLALRAQWPDAKFIGAGGPKMAAAGVELAVDMTQHAVVGIPTIGKIFALKRLSDKLLALGAKRTPDAVIGVDYGGFNLRFGRAVKDRVLWNGCAGWNPKIVQFVSPQVWASRPWRAKQLAADYDLLLSIFPFEKAWYAQRVPELRVEFVGHPMVERTRLRPTTARQAVGAQSNSAREKSRPMILLLPGSRKSELKHHLPVMLGALKLIREKLPSATAKMVLPNEEMKQLALSMSMAQSDVEIQTGRLPEALAQADLAITKTGTVTMECAFHGVPAVTMYKKSLLGLAIALGIVTVKSLTMPNLMAGEEVYPEFIQDAATPSNVARAAMELLQDESRRDAIKARLAKIIASLGEPGASSRAAEAISSLLS